MLVFEDLQWADTGLLDFIDHLLDWSRGLPLMVATLARPEVFDRRPDWGAGRRHLTALSLGPLTDAAVREMLNGLVPGLPEDALAAIVGRAEGVPLYAVETVRGLLADGRIERVGDAYQPVGDLSRITVPDSLRSLIASRLDGLDAADRSLLQDAAVLGQVFGTDALAAVSGTGPSDLEARLRDLVRRELLDVERDPKSPERGQHKFVQSLIREVAYGTLARRDRRTRHLAVARHYEGIGDEEMAGALANHYLAAHEASEQGPEADAVATQARLAFTAAADRAATLGAPDQAIAYLEQALTITTEPGERAPLFDRAARAASAAARDAVGYAEAAVEAYRQLGDRAAAARATARLGQVLLDGSQVEHAAELLEAALSEAESVDDASVLAETLAYLARAYMRMARGEEAVAAADRALSIAERLNLDDIVAEAFVNKGSALQMLGRRREAAALHVAALDTVERLGARSLELRIRNNLAMTLWEDDPARATRVLLEAMELARQIGDRAHFNRLAGTVAVRLYDEGRDWDAHAAVLREALETATLRADRGRLRVLLGLHETARGERLEELVADLSEIAGDSTDMEVRFGVLMATGDTALVSGNTETAYRSAMDLFDLHSQDPEIRLALAMRAAIWSADLERARLVGSQIAELPFTGGLTETMRQHSGAAVAALEGRTAEALAGFRKARSQLEQLEQRFTAACYSIDAAVLLPGEPEVRGWAAEIRPLLEELRVRPYLERLDEALASVPTADARAAKPVPTPR